MYRSLLTTAALALALTAVVSHPVTAQLMPKAQVGNLIVKVENGVDEFRKYLDKRSENAGNAAAAPAAGRRARQGASEDQKAKATEDQKARAADKKDKLDDALGELNRSTNRLRRKFDPIDNWIETKVEVQRVVDDGRAINTELGRGNYGSEAARLWAVLRTGINDLARAYNVPPLGI